MWLKQANPDLKCIVNDVNQELVHLYTHIRDNPDLIIILMDKWEQHYLSLTLEKRKEFYYSMRTNYWTSGQHMQGKEMKSALLYFLMKTSFNGIWQTCKESHGEFGTPFGLGNQTDKVYDKEQVLAWSSLLKNTQINCGDFESFEIPENSLIYCDPPYTDSYTSYGTNFDNNEQIRLINWANKQKDIGNRVFLSNRETDDHFIINLLKPSSAIYTIPITYTAGRRKKTINGFEAKKATELLVDF